MTASLKPEKRQHKPLPDEYILQYYNAAKSATMHTTKRRQWNDGKWGSPVGVLMLIAEIADLKKGAIDMLALIKETRCPGGGWNGMPEGMQAEVKDCLAARACGCVYGDAVKKAEGQS